MRALKLKVILCCALLALAAPAQASSATVTKAGKVAALGGEIGLIVHVQFSDNGLAIIVRRELFERGRNHPAWAAPIRPEVHQNRLG